MAHIIGDIGVMPRTVKRQVLSCMNEQKSNVCKKDIYNSDKIKQSLENASKIKQQLETDVFERESNIKNSAEYRENVLK
jgi:hypothetical protein